MDQPIVLGWDLHLSLIKSLIKSPSYPVKNSSIGMNRHIWMRSYFPKVRN